MALVGGTSYANFKPEVWSEALNEQLHTINVALGLTNTRYRGEINEFGDTVRAQRPGSVTSRAYTGYADTTWEQPSPSQSTITVDQANYAAVDVDDIDVTQSRPDVLGAHVSEAGFALSDSVDSFIFESYTAAGSGVGSDHDNPVRLTSVNAYEKLVDAGEVLDSLDVPDRGRWVALSETETANLRSNPQFVRGLPATERGIRYGQRAGEIGSVAGFSVFETNNLTTVSGVRKVLCGHNVAIGMAGPVTDVRLERRESRFADAVKMLTMYGKNVVESNALAVIHAQT